MEMGERGKPLLEWSSEYELGVGEIDLQHRYFMMLINRLYQALQSGDDYAFQVALLKELNAYVKFHFISEENMMRQAGYAHLAEHHRHHIELIDKLNGKESILTVRYNADDARVVIEFLVQWFNEHTTGEDLRFAEYLNQQRAE